MSEEAAGTAGGSTTGPPQRQAAQVDLRLPPRPPRSRTGCQRWAGTGCLAGMVVLVAAIICTVMLMRSGVRWAVDRAHTRLAARLAVDVSGPSRESVRAQLEAFVASLDHRDDALPVMGQFLGHAADALEDDRLTDDEVRSLADFLEEAGASPGGSGTDQP